jgi:hypothetical protein
MKHSTAMTSRGSADNDKFETDDDRDSSEDASADSSEWEDVILSGSDPKIDDKPLFSPVKLKRDAEIISVLTAMLSGSVPAGPVEISGAMDRSHSPNSKEAIPK